MANPVYSADEQDASTLDLFLIQLKEQAPAAFAIVEAERRKAEDGDARIQRAYEERHAALKEAKVYKEQLDHLSYQLHSDPKMVMTAQDKRNAQNWKKLEAHHRKIADEILARDNSSYSIWNAIKEFPHNLDLKIRRRGRNWLETPDHRDRVYGRDEEHEARKVFKFVPKIGKAPSDSTKAEKQLAVANESLEYFRDQLKRTEIARLPIETAREEVMRVINKAAQAGEPNVAPAFRMIKQAGGLGRRQGRFDFPKHMLPLSLEHYEPSSLEFICWLFKDQITARMDGLLVKHASDGAIPLSERPAKIAEINGHLDSLQYEIGALLNVIEESGKVVNRSGLTVPAALQIEAVMIDDDLSDFG